MNLGQFLISYWWIFALFIVVIVLVTKSVLKSILSILLVGGIIAVLWQIFIAPGFVNITNCFTDEASSQTETYDAAISMSPGKARNEFICQRDVASHERLTQCFAQSQQENSLSYFLYSNMPKFKSTIAETIQSHNELCPENRLK